MKVKDAIRAARRYRAFLGEHKSGKVLYLEWGVGGNTLGIIKYPFLRYIYENPASHTLA